MGLVAAATFPHLRHALLVPACYLALAVIEGNFVTPYSMGRLAAISVTYVAGLKCYPCPRPYITHSKHEPSRA